MNSSSWSVQPSISAVRGMMKQYGRRPRPLKKRTDFLRNDISERRLSLSVSIVCRKDGKYSAGLRGSSHDGGLTIQTFGCGAISRRPGRCVAKSVP